MKARQYGVLLSVFDEVRCGWSKEMGPFCSSVTERCYKCKNRTLTRISLPPRRFWRGCRGRLQSYLQHLRPLKTVRRPVNIGQPVMGLLRVFH